MAGNLMRGTAALRAYHEDFQTLTDFSTAGHDFRGKAASDLVHARRGASLPTDKLSLL